MRFVFVLPNLAGGGAEKAMLKVARGLVARDHEVTLFLFEETLAYSVPPGVGVHCAYPGKHKVSKGWLAKRLLARKLRRFIAARRVDLVVSTLPFADEVAALADIPRHWCRIANTLSAEIADLAVRHPAKAARRLARYRRIYGSRPLIAVSQGVAEDLRHGLGLAQKIAFIPNPFDFRSIRQAAQASADLPEAPYVLHVGRFSQQKRHDLLLDAWKKIDVPHKLVLLTQPEAGLHKMIADRQLQARVVVAGFQSNPYPWMAGADLLVLCSDREGLPNVLIEALACGTAVVSTDCPSGPREILAAGAPQALVPCGDVERLAAAIGAALSSPPDIGAVDLARYAEDGVIAAYEKLAAEQEVV